MDYSESLHHAQANLFPGLLSFAALRKLLPCRDLKSKNILLTRAGEAKIGGEGPA